MSARIRSSLLHRARRLLPLLATFAALLGLIPPAQASRAAACAVPFGFAPKVDYSFTIGNGALQAGALGDLNGDGRLDLVASGGAFVGVRLASGAPGTFAPMVGYNNGGSFDAVELGDLNGDGRLDIVLANRSPSVSFSVLLASGTPGTFAPRVDHPTGTGSESLALGDVNGDGRLDVVLVTRSSTVSVLLGNGDGTFAANVDYPTGNLPYSVALGDLNGDGRLDLVTANYVSNDVSVLLASGAPGTFAPKVDYPSGTTPFAVALGDLDGDGRLDIAVGNFGFANGSVISVLLASGAPGAFATKVDYPVDGNTMTLALGDLNGDGRLDLAFNNRYRDAVSVMLASGAPGTFAPKIDYPAGYDTVTVALGDINNDGRLDIAATDNGAPRVIVLFNRAPPASLTIAVPSSTPANAAFTSTATVHGSCGNTITDYTGPVTIAIKAGSGTAGAVLGGTLTVNAVNGVATFSNLTIDRGGADYVLNATAEVASSDSPAFTVTVPPNNPPLATPQTPSGSEDTDLLIALAGSDADSDPLSYSISALPASGALYQTTAGGTRGAPIATLPATVSDASHRVIFAPAANASGSPYASFTFMVNDGTVDSKDATVTIAIAPVNDRPALDAIADLSVVESAPAQTVNLSGISAGPADESGQTLTVTAASSNPALITNPSVTYTSPSATGTLSFTPAAAVSGSATISVVVTDSGSGVAPNANTFTRTFVVFVGAVNTRPTLNQPANLNILEDSAAQTVNLSGIGAGSADESGQTLTVTAASSNPALIANPTVTYSSPNAAGSLSYLPAANASGSATITVTVRDDGGTAKGGIDFRERVFTIGVAAVNDAPSFTIGASQIVSATAGPQVRSGWATGFVPGPADEGGQTLLEYAVVSNSNAAIFAVVPAVAANGTLTYTPKPGTSGTATIGVAVRDSGGTANGGTNTSPIKTFTITVRSIYRVSLPLIVRSGAADLVVTSIRLSPSKTSLAAGEPVEISVVVKNQGTAPATGFWVDLSINPDRPPASVNQPWDEHCALTPCLGIAWPIQELAPGASITLTSKSLPADYSIWPGWFAAGTTDLYAYADSYNPGAAAGAIAESDETNNQFHLGELTVAGANPTLVGPQSIADLRERPVHLP